MLLTFISSMNFAHLQMLNFNYLHFLSDISWKEGGVCPGVYVWEGGGRSSSEPINHLPQYPFSVLALLF